MSKVELSLEVDLEIAEEAKRLDVDLAAAGAAGMQRAVAIRREAIKSDAERSDDARAWAAENAAALEAYRARIERDGIFGEDFRTW